MRKQAQESERGMSKGFTKVCREIENANYDSQAVKTWETGVAWHEINQVTDERLHLVTTSYSTLQSNIVAS